jgi:3'-5' exoribonuclease
MAGNSTPEKSTQPVSSLRRTTVASLRKGDRIVDGSFLVETANFKQTRNNKHFIQLLLRDRTGSIKAVRWEASQELFNSFSAGDFLHINGRVEEFQQNLQIVVDGLERVPPEAVDFEEFLPVAPRDPGEMERELLESVASVQDPSIKALLSRFLEDQEIRRGLLRCPAGKVLHHAYVGGLLEHILSLVGAARLLAKNYPRLNPDILVAAAVLHDIGKIRELSYTRAFGYTDEGQLLGHIGIGLLMIEEKARRIPGFPASLLLHLQHIIVSHHGLPEHGALKPPMTAEAIAFHYLDNLDAKLAMVESLKQELDIADEATDQDRRWTDFQPSLGRRLYFPGG